MSARDVVLMVVVGPSLLILALCALDGLLGLADRVLAWWADRADDRLAADLVGVQVGDEAEQYSNDMWRIRQWSAWRDQITEVVS